MKLLLPLLVLLGVLAVLTPPSFTIVQPSIMANGGIVSTGMAPGHSYPQSGTYETAPMVSSKGASLGTAVPGATVQARGPVAKFTESATTAQTGTSVSFNASTSSDPDGTIINYSWSFGDTATGNGVTTSHSYATAGLYIVTLLVTDNNTRTATASAVKTITDRSPVARFTESATTAQTGTSISFNASTSSDPDGTITMYAWSFGDSSTGSGVTTTHTYATAGTYIVTLTVADNNANTGTTSATKTITDRPPIAKFSENATSTLTGVAISFNASNSTDPDGTVVSYAWSFGDGSTGTSVTTTHSYAKAGSYTVTLTVTDDSGSTAQSSSTKTVIDRPPVARFTESVSTALTGVSISFNATTSSDPDGTITSYAWDFGDSNTGTGATMTHSYATAGSYTVTLKVTDNSGSTAMATSVKTIIDRPPTVQFSEDKTTATRLDNITVTYSSSDSDGTIASVKVDWGDGTVHTFPTSSGSDTHTYPNLGTYTVKVTATDNSGNAASAAAGKTIKDIPPTAKFTESNTSVLTGVGINFNATTSSDSDGTVISYAWNFGDGNTGTGKTQSHSYSTAGTYTVTLNVTDNDGSVGTTSSIKTILDRPPVPKFTESVTSALTGVPITFDASTSSDPDGTIVSYRWNFGDGSTATGVTTSHSYANTGSSKSAAFTVTLNVTDNSGNSAVTASVKAITDRPPVARFTESVTSALTGVTITFDASTSSDADGSVLNYAWNFGDGTTGTSVTAFHSYSNTGSTKSATFTVALNVTDNSGNSAVITSLKTITDRPPVAKFTESVTAALTGVSISFDASTSSDSDGTIASYAWNFGDGSTGTGVTTSHGYANTGGAKSATFTVTLNVTDNSGNSATTTSVKTITDRPPVAKFTESVSTAPTGASISFNATTSSDPDGSIASYAWNFGDGSTGSGVTVNHGYANTGNAKSKQFTVTLNVTDNSGNSATTTSVKTINDRVPVARFTESVTSALTTVSISFDASTSSDSDGTISGYAWNFGDTNTGTGLTITHSYAVAGAYNVTLTVTDNSGNTASSSSIKTIQDRPPVAKFIESVTTALTAVSISFDASTSTDPDGTISSYAWNFGDTNTGSGVTTSHSYAVAGTYNVTLTVTDNSGNSATTSSLKTINDRPPTVSFSEDKTTATRLDVITVTYSSSDPDGSISSVKVDWGDGTVHTFTSASGTDTHTYSTLGTFTVKVTATDNSGSTASATAVKTIKDIPPTARFTESSTNVLTGVPINFNATTSIDPDGTIVSYTWDFGDGNIGTGTATSHFYDLAGAYTVILTVTDNNGSTATATSVKTIIDRPPVASFTESVTSASTGTLISFNAGASSDPDGTVVSYTWSFGDGTPNVTRNNPTTSHTYTTTGSTKTATYTVILTVTDDSGNKGSTSSVKTITDRPPVARFTESVTSAMTGVSITFDASTSSDADGTVASYAWNFGDGSTATGVTTSHSYANTGSSKSAAFTVTLNVTDNSGSSGVTSSVKTITDRPPVAKFTESVTSALTGVTINFDASTSSDSDGTIASYAWNFGDGSTGTGVTISHSYANTGNAKSATFTVTLNVTDNSGNSGVTSSVKTITDRPSVAKFTESATSVIANSPITFDASTSNDPDGTIASYAWNFGDGSTATGVAASHTYTSAGTFTVTLNVTDNSGNSATTTSVKTVSADETPTARFTESVTSALTGISISFNATTSSDPDGHIVSYAWDFGDGSTGAGVTLSHNYSNTGGAKSQQFTVTLTVTDNSTLKGSTTSIKTISDRTPVAKFTETVTSGLTGVSISFDASTSSDPDGTVASYAWNFGDGSTGTGVTTSHSYANTGNSNSKQFTVTLNLTDNSGNSATTTSIKTITDRPPVAKFTESLSSALTGVSITFDASTSSDPDGTVASYAWNFGDGSTGTGITTSHSYANTGSSKSATFTVTLNVTDNSGNSAVATSVKTITDRPPVAKFIESATSALTGVSITLDASTSSDSDGTVVTYAWNFGDGSTSTGVTTSHGYANIGSAKSATFTVTLNVTDNSGSSAVATSIKTITDRPPVARFTESVTSALTGVSITFDASTSSDPDGTISKYSWNFGDGSAGTGVNTSHSYSNTGSSENATFTVTLNVTDNSGNSGISTSVKTITDRPPVARFTESVTSALTRVSITFDASTSSDPDGTIASYAWDFGDGTGATGVTTSHSYANTGNLKIAHYTVTLNVTDNSGNSAISTSIKTITDRHPVARFTESVTSALTGVAISFNATTSTDADGTIASYDWNFGDTNVGTGAIASHAYAAAGSYTVTLTVTDNSGNTGTASSIKTIDEKPTASFTESATSVLTGVSISFDASTSSDPDGSIVSYAWTFGDSFTGSGVTTSHSYAAAGTYTVNLTITDSSGVTAKASSVKTIIDRPPVAKFTESLTTALTGVSIAFDASTSSDVDGTIVSYSWSFGDGFTATGVTTSHSYAGTGNAKSASFTVTLNVTDNSGNPASTTSVKSIQDRPPMASFTFTPTNPGVGSVVSFNGTVSSDPDGSIVGYFWTFGDTATGSGAIATHAYSATGNYTVTLMVTDNQGNTNSASKVVTVSTLALASNPGGGLSGSACTGSATEKSEPGPSTNLRDQGQTFKITNSSIINAARFCLSTATSTVSGHGWVVLYKVTGSYGTNSTPTGGAIAQSNKIDLASTLNGPNTGKHIVVTFNFNSSQQVAAKAGDLYALSWVWQASNTTNYDINQWTTGNAYSGNPYYCSNYYPTGTTCNGFGGTWNPLVPDFLFEVDGALTPDVSVTTMKESRSFAYAGVMSNPVQVNVTAQNFGPFMENFTVFAKANNILIGSRSVVNLLPGGTRVLVFNWTTQSLLRSNYTLNANVTGASVGSLYTGGLFTVRLQGDVNNDCKVDIQDLSLVAASFGKRKGEVGYNPYADINNDGTIDIIDLSLVSANFGRTCT